MAKVNEVVQRIESHYVGDDCIQVMAPYKSEITILNKDGIIYSHKEGSLISINNYVDDERRKQFPYSNIPTHYSKVGFFGKMNFANQLFDFEKPYIRIVDNHIIESFAVKDKNEALLINKVIIAGDRKTKYITRQELEELFKENQNKLVLYLEDESISVGQYHPLASEEKIYKYVKNEITENVEEFRKYVDTNRSSTVGWYLCEHPLFLDFVEQGIKSFDLKNMELDIGLKGGRAIIVNSSENDMTMQYVRASFVSINNYKIDIVDLPVNKYTLEQLKNLSPIIIKTKEPRISLKLNPGVSKQEFQEAKQMVKTLKK